MSLLRADVVRGAADPSAAALPDAVAAGFAFRPVVVVADELVPVAELAVVAAAESTVLGGDAEPVL
jgi:hypothetical protein